MTQAELVRPIPVETPAVKDRTIKPPNDLLRVLRFILMRGLVLFLMVVAIVWITIIVANLGGYADEIKRADIIYGISISLREDMHYWSLETEEERQAYVEQLREQAFEAAGLNQPFLLRTFWWLGDGLTLGWGLVGSPTRLWEFTTVQELILQSLPKTLYMFASANVLLFITSVIASLRLMRRPDSLLNKLITALSPLSAIPAWIVGMLLFALVLRLELFDLLAGSFDAWPSELPVTFSVAYIPIVLKFLLLPVSAILLSKFFYSTHTWRSFFQLYEQEPHVEMARAKGLKPNVVERKYILRAALPAVLTSFALLLIGMWQEVIILEQIFNVTGLGKLFFTAVEQINTPVIVGCVTVFAYMLAIVIFLLDISYVLVDPRIAAAQNDKAQHSVGAVPAWQFWKRRSVEVGLIPAPRGQGFSLSALVEGIHLAGRTLMPYIKEILRTPASLIGLIFIVFLVIVSIVTVIVLPYEEVVSRWRGDNGEWVNSPINADPMWVNFFLADDLPPSLALDSREGAAIVEQEKLSETQKRITLDFTIDYPYNSPPDELVVNYFAQYDDKQPFITLKWITPDGREFDLGGQAVPEGDYRYNLGEDEQLARKLRSESTIAALFADPASPGDALPGQYKVRVSGLFFETEDPQLDIRLGLQGRVYGWAGTDVQGRDLMLPLLWGMPVALMFGVLGAFGTAIAMVILAAVSTWFGGWVDSLIQRLTEMNMILPFFPLAVMIFVLYSNTIWLILAVTILLNIFGSSIKTYRAMFLQTKQSSYIEAARAYGASDMRIIFVYLIPRVAVLLIPQIMILIPSYVFLEAALAALGVSDPYLPTWGKLIALSFQSVFAGNFYKSFAAFLLIITGYAFAMIGFTVERKIRRDTDMV